MGQFASTESKMTKTKLSGQTDGQTITCNFCEKTFSRDENRIRHERIHTGEKPYSCSHCGKRFSYNKWKRAHEKQCEKSLNGQTGKTNSTCNFCEKTFSRKESRIKHERIHTGEKPYNCSYCDKRFSDSSDRRSHEAHVHKRELKAHGKNRRQNLALQPSLKEKKQKNIEEKPFACTQ